MPKPVRRRLSSVALAMAIMATLVVAAPPKADAYGAGDGIYDNPSDFQDPTRGGGDLLALTELNGGNWSVSGNVVVGEQTFGISEAAEITLDTKVGTNGVEGTIGLKADVAVGEGSAEFTLENGRLVAGKVALKGQIGVATVGGGIIVREDGFIEIEASGGIGRGTARAELAVIANSGGRATLRGTAVLGSITFVVTHSINLITGEMTTNYDFSWNNRRRRVSAREIVRADMPRFPGAVQHGNQPRAGAFQCFVNRKIYWSNGRNAYKVFRPDRQTGPQVPCPGIHMDFHVYRGDKVVRAVAFNPRFQEKWPEQGVFTCTANDMRYFSNGLNAYRQIDDGRRPISGGPQARCPRVGLDFHVVDAAGKVVRVIKDGNGRVFDCRTGRRYFIVGDRYWQMTQPHRLVRCPQLEGRLFEGWRWGANAKDKAG